MNTAQQVTGKYMGHTFSGVIKSSRAITVKTDGCFEFVVALDQPITIFGTERNSLCVHTKFDGQPSTYSRGEISMVAA